jgi:hypothetical protein
MKANQAKATRLAQLKRVALKLAEEAKLAIALAAEEKILVDSTSESLAAISSDPLAAALGEACLTDDAS